MLAVRRIGTLVEVHLRLEAHVLHIMRVLLVVDRVQKHVSMVLLLLGLLLEPLQILAPPLLPLALDPVKLVVSDLTVECP